MPLIDIGGIINIYDVNCIDQGSVNVVWCYKQSECKRNCELFGRCLNVSLLFSFSFVFYVL